jgi:hypothetical protein
VIEHDNITQKGTAKKKSTGRKKEDWHGLSLEEKNEIVSTEIEIYQTAIERVNNFMLIYVEHQCYRAAVCCAKVVFTEPSESCRHRKLVRGSVWRSQPC